MSLTLFIALPLLASFLMPFYRRFLRPVTLGLDLGLAGLVYALYAHLPIQEMVSFSSPLSIAFRLDTASYFFVALFVGIRLFDSLYRLREAADTAYFIVGNLFLVGVLGLVLSADIFNLYIFFEIASISAYIFTAMRQDRQGYAGAIKYMIVGGIASIFLLLAIMLIYLHLGYLTLSAIGAGFHALDATMQRLILVLLFIGFGIKAEIFPLNIWVADIYQAAPIRVDALFSSMLSKAYLFLFFHLVYTLHPDPASLRFLTIIGLMSFAVAELSALRSRNLKRIFAYSTLGQLGVAFAALASSDPFIVAGALFLIGAHSLSKVLLFLGLDAIEEASGSVQVKAFAAFRSPFLVTVFAVGFLSILGIPPLAGFIAKLTILEGFAASGHLWIVGSILVISLIEATYFFRLLSQRSQTEKTFDVSLSPGRTILLSLLAIGLIVLGIFPGEAMAFCTHAAQIFLAGVPHV